MRRIWWTVKDREPNLREHSISRCETMNRIWLLLHLTPKERNNKQSLNQIRREPCDSALAYQTLCKLDDRRRSYDVILIIQDGGHSVVNLFLVSGLATSNIREGRKLSAYQISTRYLNPRPRYYYFRFLKQKVVILKFYFRFQCWLFTVIGMWFSIGLPNFTRNRMICGKVMTS